MFFGALRVIRPSPPSSFFHRASDPLESWAPRGLKGSPRLLVVSPEFLPWICTSHWVQHSHSSPTLIGRCALTRSARVRRRNKMTTNVYIHTRYRAIDSIHTYIPGTTYSTITTNNDVLQYTVMFFYRDSNHRTSIRQLRRWHVGITATQNITNRSRRTLYIITVGSSFFVFLM